MAGNLTFERLCELVDDKTIDTVVTAFVDMQGRLTGKRMSARYFIQGAYEETHACNYLLATDIDNEMVQGYAGTSWAAGYGDFVLKPDMSTLCLTPWLAGTALVLCDVLDHHGEPIPYSPRAMLKKQTAKLAERGWTAALASELEFYIFKDSYAEAAKKGYKKLETSGYYIEDYAILQTSREEPLLRAFRNGLEGAGIPVENSKGEWGPGQSEINVRYGEAVEMADRHSILKNGMKEIADQHGVSITFMAKYDYNVAGNSAHVHASLWDKASGKPLFHDPNGEHGMSEMCRQFLAGQLHHARALTYFLAPYINSYKRFQAGTFAPTKAVWSIDNRTAGFRLCGHGKALRVECRMPGGDINPYLTFAALLAAGLDGIDKKMELEPMQSGDNYGKTGVREIPKTLREAIGELEKSEMLRAAFGDDVIEHYLHTARWEQFEYDRRVTDWELWRGFERT
jgi:glutamine synthetase